MRLISYGALLVLGAGCASTTFSGYSSGTVKYSAVNYQYTAQPLVRDTAGRGYRVDAPADLGGAARIAVLDRRGLAGGGTDYVFEVRGGRIHHEPGGFGLGGKYQPALLSTMPITITVRESSGRALLERQVQHESALTIPGAKTFRTRQDAKAAMSSVTEVMRASADKKVRASAAQTVRKNLQLIAQTMLEPREVKVTLPAVRSAGGLDLEVPYGQLADAKSQDQVVRAREAYARLGVDHTKQDGSADVVANYGVMCGTASAQVLEGDLGGAWRNVRLAHSSFPEGKEHRQIAQVILQQQREAGVEIVPPEEVQDMMNADLARLRQLFGG